MATANYRFELDVLPATSALARIIMVLSRRRLTPEQLHWQDENAIDHASLHIHVNCTPAQALELNGQWGRIVEVATVRTVPLLAEAVA